MKVQLAHIAGFCMGVRKAMDLALKVSREFPGPIYTYGPLIHNPSALELLKEKGIGLLERIPEKGTGTVIIRAHGVTPEEERRLEEAGFTVISGTCPRVIKVQSIASHYSQRGYACLVIGDEGHPEVRGILGHAGKGGILISSEEAIDRLSIKGPYIVVAQTTQDRERFKKWTGKILERFPGGKIFDTICDSTKRRQEEVKRLSGEVDAVVVVGGKKSANTRRLAEIAQEEGKPVFFVETQEDIEAKAIKRFSTVGVTAGASTPNWVINGVVRRLESIPGRNEPIWKRTMGKMLHFLHESNLWTSLGGAALCMGTSKMLGQAGFRYPLIVFLFVFSMHTLGRLMDKESGKFNDPLRTAFLVRHQAVLYLLSILSIMASLILTLFLSHLGFYILLGIVAFGLPYSVTPLKDIPGSKTLFVAAAWATVTVLVPCTNIFGSYQCWIVLVLAFSLVFMRNALMEIIDVQGDRIVGKETMTLLLGEERVLRLVARLSVFMAAISGTIPFLLEGIPFSTLGFLPAFLYGLFLVGFFRKGRLGKNLKLELMVEAMNFIIYPAAVFVCWLAS